MPRNPVVDRTYRVEDGRVNYWKEAARMISFKVVVYIPSTGRWKQAWLLGLLPNRDEFVVKWTRRGRHHLLHGIWRVHQSNLFRLERHGGRMLPIPVRCDMLPQSTNTDPPKEGRMATKPKTGSKTGASKTSSKGTTATGKAATNGGTTRGQDKLAGLTDAKKRNIAKLITRERAKTPATSWPKVTELIQAKYGWALPGSMTGRRLMREFGPDNAEDAIIKQERKPGAKKASTKKVKASPAEEALAGLSRVELKQLIKDEELEVRVLKSMDDDALRAAIIGAGWVPEDDADVEEEEDLDEEEDDTEDEEDEDTDEDDEEDEDDDEEDTDDDDEEDEEEDEPEPVKVTPKRKPAAAKKPPAKKPAAKRVAVKRKPAAKPNPSK